MYTRAKAGISAQAMQFEEVTFLLRLALKLKGSCRGSQRVGPNLFFHWLLIAFTVTCNNVFANLHMKLYIYLLAIQINFCQRYRKEVTSSDDFFDKIKVN